jgi:beta-lactam-binding protein with PASTA domain
VPNVVGKTLSSAKKLLTRAHCRLGTIKKKRASKHRIGRVIAQSKKSGKSYARNTKVTLTLGKR